MAGPGLGVLVPGVRPLRWPAGSLGDQLFYPGAADLAGGCHEAHRCQCSGPTPSGHGTYQGLDLELLDPHDEGELTFLLEAQHLDLEEALESDEELLNADGEPMNPRLHVTLHVVVANQLLAGEPPETWQTVQRLAGLGYDWHNVMHMIMGPVAEAVYQTMAEKRPFDRADYVRRLAKLPGDWPPPEELDPRLCSVGGAEAGHDACELAPRLWLPRRGVGGDDGRDAIIRARPVLGDDLGPGVGHLDPSSPQSAVSPAHAVPWGAVIPASRTTRPCPRRPRVRYRPVGMESRADAWALLKITSGL